MSMVKNYTQKEGISVKPRRDVRSKWGDINMLIKSSFIDVISNISIMFYDINCKYT